MAVVIDPSPALRNGAQPMAPGESLSNRQGSGSGAGGGAGGSSSRSAARQISDRINAASAFLPVQTNQRWQEEGRVLQGHLTPSRLPSFLVLNIFSTIS